MNDEDPVVIEREYKKYMKGESHAFNLYELQCKGLLSVPQVLLVSAAGDVIKEAPEA